MTISFSPGEQGSIDLAVSLSVTPLTMYWTLRDSGGTVINSRTAVEVTSPTDSETIKLSGDDLAIFTDEPSDRPRRYFRVYGTYDDGGNTRKYSKEESFMVDDYVCVDPVDRS